MLKITERVTLVGSEQFGLSHVLDCNMYLVDGGAECALIDTGTGFGCDDVQSNIIAAGYEPQQIRYIIVTHHHAGHTGGCNSLQEWTGATIVAPRDGVAAIEQGLDPGIKVNRASGLYPADYEFPTVKVGIAVDDGEQIRIGDCVLQAMRVRGHTQDSTCYLLEEGDRRLLFSGDTVFYGGMVGIVNLPGCSLDDYREEIKKLGGLNIDMLLPAHGVFVMRNGQQHIDEAIRRFSRVELPESFFERNPFALAI